MRSSVLITGCSSGGAGNAIAREYHARGLHVFATARRMEAMADLKDIAGITLVPLDVTNIESIRNARETVASALGAGKGLDILVNNAGVATVMPALDYDISATRQMFEANLFGMMAMVQEFMPLLLLSSDACIVNIGSIAGLIPFAFGSSYNASKAAVHSYSDTLRLELKPLGIKVTTVWLGGVKTNMTMQKPTPLPENSYYASIEAIFRKARAPTDNLISPEEFARDLVTATLKNSPARHLELGQGAKMVSWMSWLMPAFLLDYIISKMLGLEQLSAIRRATSKNK